MFEGGCGICTSPFGENLAKAYFDNGDLIPKGIMAWWFWGRRKFQSVFESKEARSEKGTCALPASQEGNRFMKEGLPH